MLGVGAIAAIAAYVFGALVEQALVGIKCQIWFPNKPNFVTPLLVGISHDGKLLLVKHRKLGFWLAPEVILDPEELPHLVLSAKSLNPVTRARASDPQPLLPSTTSEYIPPRLLVTCIGSVKKTIVVAYVMASTTKLTLPKANLANSTLGLYLMKVVEHAELIRWWKFSTRHWLVLLRIKSMGLKQPKIFVELHSWL